MPSSGAYRQRKHRTLKKLRRSKIETVRGEVASNSNLQNGCNSADKVSAENSNVQPQDIASDLSMSLEGEVLNSFDGIEHDMSICSSSTDEVNLQGADSVDYQHEEQNAQEIPLRVGLKEKLRDWMLKNRKTLNMSVVSELLVILRGEGHRELPKTCQTLIHTPHRRELQRMLSAKKTEAEYLYVGIEKTLNRMISSPVYVEDHISLIVHIDGMQAYNDSVVTVWPITIKLYHPDYDTIPAVVGIYGGDSKPHSIDEYMKDFIEEAAALTENGVTLDGKLFTFKVMAITADAPARAFLKCSKGAGGYFACERCTTRGISVGVGRNQTRVYPEMNCAKRTKESFELKGQPQHHHKDSPLLQIPNFDPVKHVVLDAMHLFYSCIMKGLLEKWIGRSSSTRIKLCDVRALQLLLDQVTADVPLEFQRSSFDISKCAGWKATQYRFFLHYCGPMILETIVSKDCYRHFLLLYTACRILNSNELILTHLEHARELLQTFFYLLPSIYGAKSQILSFHNLLHVADDVETFRAPLSDLSAFWGENYIANFKKFLQSSFKPLTQIANRLSELEAEDRIQVRKRSVMNVIDERQHCGVVIYNGKEYVGLSSVTLLGVTIKPTHPNNHILLSNGKVFTIEEILWKQGRHDVKNVYFVGYEARKQRQLFACKTERSEVSSIDVGYMQIQEFSERKKIVSGEDMKYKCVLFNLNGLQYATTFMHAYHDQQE